MRYQLLFEIDHFDTVFIIIYLIYELDLVSFFSIYARNFVGCFIITFGRNRLEMA